jgi:hypothetical protein
MLNRVWGFDTETVEKGVRYGKRMFYGGYPYTFQLTCGAIRLYYENPSLSPQRFRRALFNAIGRYCEDGDCLFSYNLTFENAVIFRDHAYFFQLNRIKRFMDGVQVEGVMDDPTPFLSLKFKDGKKVMIIDAAKYFSDGGNITLDTVLKSFTGIKKLKRPDYLGKRTPEKSEREYFKNYAMVDAIGTEELGKIVKKYHQEAGLDEWCFSAAHLAGTYFNNMFCHKRKLDFSSNQIEGFASWARFGGYRKYHANQGVYRDYVHLDLESAYPWAMFNMRSYFDGHYRRTRVVPKDGEAIIKIRTVLPKEETRPLFLKRGKGNLEEQPLNERIQFWTTGLEINAYRKVWGRRFKFEILDGWEWVGQRKYKPLKEWVKKFYALKKQTKKEDKVNGWKRSFAKAMLNHLTGKFDASISLGKEQWLTGSGEIELQKVKPGMVRNYFVAALLRAKIRARVWGDSRYWKRTPRNSSIQEMTDSIDVPLSELHRFKTGEGLGRWGEEVRGDIVFLRAGTYFYFDSKKRQHAPPLKLAYHGLQLKKKDGTFDYKRMLTLALKGEGTYTRKKMIRVKESLRRDGMGAGSALSFHDVKFNFPPTTKKMKEELKIWLSKKKPQR